MKRQDVIRELVRAGCHLLRSGKRHDIYRNAANGRQSPVPRHREVKNSLCALIRRQLGLQ
jgi:mRNA interferase HicA